MIEAYLKPLKELLDLLLKFRPYMTQRKERQLKIALARLYFLIIELRDSSNYFLCWVKHSQRYEYSRFYFGCALKIVNSMNGIVTKILELISREFANEVTLTNLLRIDNEDLMQRLHMLVGMKRSRLHMWERILKELSNRNEKAGEEARSLSIDSMEKSHVFLLRTDFEIPQFEIPFSYEYDKFHDEFAIEETLVPVEVTASTIDEEVQRSEAAIRQIDEFLEAYRPFLKEHVTMTDLLGS